MISRLVRPCQHASFVQRLLSHTGLSPLSAQVMQQNGRQHNGRQRVHKRHLQTASGGAPPGLQQFEPDQMQHPASGYKQAKVSPDAKLAVHPSAMNGGSLQQTRTSSTTRAHLTDVHFNSLAICEPTKRALAQVLKYDVCTKVQAQSIPACLDGTDIVCKAKTGTGKTLAFLIPSLERMQAGSGHGVSALIISPTRELAQQIAVEATSLGTYHKLNVQCVVGGTNADSEAKKMARNIPNVLVATPGRLVDHLQNYGASKYMSHIDTFVLDEADRLLDMGFRKDLDKILALLPDKMSRQTLLFSATFPSDIQQLAKFALKPDFKIVDTVGEETNTSTQVKQSAMILPMQNMTAQLLYLLAEHRATDPDHKILVFCTTARLTQMYAQICGAIGMNVLEIHSRKSQSHRTKVANQFREGSGLTMFTSDVSARGVDYPDVSLVLQVGMPSEQAQYIHRIGRTARAGKQGQAILLLHDFEEFFMQSLKGLPVEQMQPSSQEVLAPYEVKAEEALRHVPADSKGAAYQAWLGFYNSSLRRLRWSSEHLVQQANLFSATIGCKSPPPLQKSTVGKMGLKGVPGINFAAPGSEQNKRQQVRQQGQQRANAQQAYDGQSQGQQAQGQSAGAGRGGRGGGGRGRGGNAGGRGGRGGRGGGGGGQQERGSQDARNFAY